MISIYKTAKEKVGFYLHNGIGVLKILGDDKIDFFQRQTTNDVTQLNDENIVTTVLTMPNARIIDVLTLVLVDDEMLCITLPGHGKSTLEFLKSKIFFNDKIEIIDVSDEYKQIDLEGPQASDFLEEINFPVPQINKNLKIQFENNPIIISAKNGLIEDIGYSLLLKSNTLSDILKILSERNIIEIDIDTREIFRVESNIPGEKSEITNQYTPLEINLNWAISDSKGCYTGQEIIARQINYDKITKKLVKIQLDKKVVLQSNIYTDGKKLGKITSIVNSPSLGALALAILKRPYFEIGTEIYVDEQGQRVPGRVIK